MAYFVIKFIWTLVFLSPQCLCLSHAEPVTKIQNALSYLEQMVDKMDRALQEMHIYLDYYTEWSECSATCGIGYMTRQKIDCDSLINDDCVQTMFCNAQPCPEEPKPRKVRHATCAMRPDENIGSTESVRGVVTLRQEEKGSLVIHLNISGFVVKPPDSDISVLEHGFHVHEYGDLSGGCATAGGHFNPKNVLHGGRLDSVRHVGDLGNIRQTPGGLVVETIVDDRASLFGDNTIIGRALVIHRDQDDLGRGGDEGSETTGNAGPRLACCVIGVAPGD